MTRLHDCWREAPPLHEGENRGYAQARGGRALQDPERHPWDVENPLRVHTDDPSHIGPNPGDDGKHSHGRRWHLPRRPMALLHQDGDSTRDGTGLAVRNRRQGHRRHGHRRGHRHGRLHHFGEQHDGVRTGGNEDVGCGGTVDCKRAWKAPARTRTHAPTRGTAWTPKGRDRASHDDPPGCLFQLREGGREQTSCYRHFAPVLQIS